MGRQRKEGAIWRICAFTRAAISRLLSARTLQTGFTRQLLRNKRSQILPSGLKREWKLVALFLAFSLCGEATLSSNGTSRTNNENADPSRKDGCSCVRAAKRPAALLWSPANVVTLDCDVGFSSHKRSQWGG